MESEVYAAFYVTEQSVFRTYEIPEVYRRLASDVTSASDHLPCNIKWSISSCNKSSEVMKQGDAGLPIFRYAGNFNTVF